MNSSNIISPHPARCLRIALGGLPNFASGSSTGMPAAHQSNVWSSTRQYKTASPAGAHENDDSNPFCLSRYIRRQRRVTKFSWSPQNKPIWGAQSKYDDSNPIFCKRQEYNQLCEFLICGHTGDSIKVPPRHRPPPANPFWKRSTIRHLDLRNIYGCAILSLMHTKNQGVR
jgi:hypothetical protein